MTDIDPAASRRGRWAREVRARLAPLDLSPTREAQIIDELSQHLEDHYRELISGGTPHDAAVRIALAQFHERNVLAERLARLRQSREPVEITPGSSSGHVLGNIWQDVRYALRILSRQPAFTAAAVLSLALGIGVNAAMFTVIHGVLLAGLPYPDGDRLTRIVQAQTGGDVVLREYEYVKEHARSFASVAA
jgi:hypothetical protein